MQIPLLGKFSLIFFAASLTAGCGASQATDLEHVGVNGQQFVLAEEPAGALTIAEAKQAASQGEVVLIGRIAAGDLSPWHDGKAAFLISDAMAVIDEGDHHHCEDSECLFCKGESSITDRQAIVQFVDQAGGVIPVDARKLLQVEENQLVVVRGRGQVDGLGNLVLSADGIYIRR